MIEWLLRFIFKVSFHGALKFFHWLFAPANVSCPP